jgi:uncharacterized protein involved in type VI secretion and phage assembly
VSSRATASIGVVTHVAGRAGAAAAHPGSVQQRDQGIVLPNVPVAVGALGFVATPAVGDLVLVVFADGDYHAPVVVGRLYHADLAPPEHGAGQLVIALPPGEADPSLSVVADGTAPSVELDIGGTTVSITSSTARIAAGDAEVSIDASGSEEVTVTSGGSTITLSKNGDATLEASANVTIKGVNVEIEGSGSVTIKGAKVEIN